MYRIWLDSHAHSQLNLVRNNVVATRGNPFTLPYPKSMDTLAPGTYIIHDTDSDRLLTYYNESPYSHVVGTRKNGQLDWQKWHVKRYPGSSMHAIQSMYSKMYIAVGQSEKPICSLKEDDAAVLELERSFQDFYLVKLTLKGTKQYLEHPAAGTHNLVNFAEKTSLQGCYWRFEKISDETGGVLKPKPEYSTPVPEASQSNNIMLPNTSILYTDDAHFHTDMLFNMPRTPFLRTQRIAALEWARKLGASNVPTIESFEECEKRLEATGK